VVREACVDCLWSLLSKNVDADEDSRAGPIHVVRKDVCECRSKVFSAFDD